MGCPLKMPFRPSARSTDQANPDTRGDSVDLQDVFDVGAESEQAQMQEQDVEWSAEMEGTGATTGDTVSNIPLGKVTLGDVAGRTGAQVAASQSAGRAGAKRTMNATAPPGAPS